MSAIVSDNLINIILAILLIAGSLILIYLFFRDYIIDFIKNLIGGNETISLGLVFF
jgi:hypothetical protein